MSLLKHGDFRLFWAAQTASMLGTHMSRVVIPLLAATLLAASPFQMGLLQATQTVAYLLVGLPAGTLVDRMRRRPVLIVCDVLRALFLICTVVGFALGWMNFAGLMVVSLAIGLASVFFEIAYHSYIPAVVGMDHLVEGNAKLESTNATARMAGPALGGSLVQLVGAYLAVSFQAFAYLLSVGLLSRIRVVEEKPEHGERRSMGADIGSGLRFILRQPVFRAITGSAATYNFFYGMALPLVMLLLVDEIGLSGTTVGLLMAISGVGGITGATVAGWLTARLGQVRTMWISYLVTVPMTLLIPFSGEGWAIALFAIPWFIVSLGIVIYNVGQVSIRQALCPPEMLGRMNASVRFIVWGILSLGSLTGGVLGEWIGVRGSLLVAGIGMTSGVLWLLLSRVSRMRDLPTEKTGPAPQAPPLASGTSK